MTEATLKRPVVVATLVFAVLMFALGAGVDALRGLAGIRFAYASAIATLLLAIPLALAVARRVGRVTHASVLLASIVVHAATLWLIVSLLGAVAVSHGASAVGWRDLFSAPVLPVTVVGIAVALVGPQLWLWLFDRRATRAGSGVVHGRARV